MTGINQTISEIRKHLDANHAPDEYSQDWREADKLLADIKATPDGQDRIRMLRKKKDLLQQLGFDLAAYDTWGTA